MERKRPADAQFPSIPSKAETERKSEDSKPPLKLVLKVPIPFKKVRASSPLLECREVEDCDELVGRLLLIDEASFPVLLEDESQTLKVLEELWSKHEDEGLVCSVLVLLAAKLFSAKSGGGLSKDVQRLLLSFVLHDSPEVKSHALSCYHTVVCCHSNESEFAKKVVEIAQKSIETIHHNIRMGCLKLIGQLGHMQGSHGDPVALIQEYCSDSDPRVRAAALQAFLTMSKRGLKMPLFVYHKASEALRDDLEDVRLVAVNLVWRLGLENVDSIIADRGMELRIVDDAFVKVCDMLNDISVMVRALAAKLLGDFNAVSSEFLNQTLDKKLMSHLKMVQSDHERQKALHQAGGSRDWDSGRTWHTNKPKMELDLDELSLVSAGACGAFVHGLEDEFMEVRSTAVDSMCQLSIKCPAFALKCVDYLVDMFNDEIQSVRLKAINSIRKVSSSIELREDQLETVLGVLKVLALKEVPNPPQE